MARTIKNKRHSEYVQHLKFLKNSMQFTLIDIAYYKNLLTPKIEAKRRGEEIAEAEINYYAEKLKWSRTVYHKTVKEIRHTKKVIFESSHFVSE